MPDAPIWGEGTLVEDVPTWGQGTVIKATDDIPTWEDAAVVEGFRAPKGFAETILNPVDAIKEHGIISNLVKNYFTPQEEYDVQKKESKRATINSVPALSQLGESLDTFEALASSGELTSEQEDQYGRMQDAYGDLYSRVEKSYDAGEFEGGGFSWEGLKEAWDKDAGGVTAEFLNGLIGSPELMITPAGWGAVATRAGAAAKAAGATQRVAKGAEVAGGLVGTSVLGGSLNAAQSAAEQLGKTGEINTDEVEQQAAIGAILAPILVGGIKAGISGVKGVGKVSSKVMLERHTNAAGKVAAKYMDEGLKPEIAIERSIDETITNPRVREELAKRHDYISDIALNKRKDPKDVTVETSGKFSAATDFIKGVGKGLDYYLSPVATQLSLKHKGLGFAVQRHDQQLGLRIKKGLDVKERVKTGVFDALPKSKADDLHYHLANQDRASALKVVEDSSDMTDSLKGLFRYLDDAHVEAESVGVKMGYLEDFFPRRIKDYTAYIKAKGYKVSELQSSLARELNKKFKIGKEEHKFRKTISVEEARKHFTPAEFDGVINKFFETRRGEPTITGAATGPKARVVKKVSKEDLAKHYHDPIKTLTDYVNTMAMKVETRRFFTDRGVTSPDDAPRIGDDAISVEDSLIDQSIGRLTRQLLDRGEIVSDDVEAISGLLHARFVGGSKSPTKLTGGAKDLLYSALLGNPFSAATQLGDIGASVYLTDVGSTVKSLIERVGPQKAKRFTMKEMGLDNLVEEMEHLRPTSKILERSLKYGLFKSVDRLGKETVINASLKKFQKQITTQKGRVKLHDKYREAFTPEEMTQLMSDIRAGRKTPNLKFMLWHELARVQPISMAEMPAGYLNNPNGRIFYMLKTFTLKQLDLVRRESIQKIKEGKVKEGVGNLMRHASILGLSNSSVAQTKAWIEGKDEEAIDDVLIANIWRNYGLSSYLAKDIAQGKLGTAALSLVVPPYKVIDDVGAAVVNGDFWRGARHIPVIGKPLKVWFEEE